MSRTVHYAGHDREGTERRASFPITDDLLPAQTIVRQGVRLELVKVERSEDERDANEAARDAHENSLYDIGVGR